jgi:hypothetical protein
MYQVSLQNKTLEDGDVLGSFQPLGAGGVRHLNIAQNGRDSHWSG